MISYTFEHTYKDRVVKTAIIEFEDDLETCGMKMIKRAFKDAMKTNGIQPENITEYALELMERRSKRRGFTFRTIDEPR